MAAQIHTAPPNSGTIQLGLTLVELFDEGVEKYPNDRAFNQPSGGGWRSMSNGEAQTAANEVAQGLRALGLEAGDKVAFFLHSDLYFMLSDLGCLIAGVVSVPIYVTNPPETTSYILDHSESKALIVSDEAFMDELVDVINGAGGIKTVVLAEGDPAKYADRLTGAEIMSFDALRQRGRDADGPSPEALRAEITADTLATLIYTSGTTGTPKGVMLTHENISSNVTSSYTGFKYLKTGQGETVLTFLPATHIYARMLNHMHAAYGQTLYFSNPDRLVSDLPDVRPTVFSTVPRVLEKVYDKVALGVDQAEGAKKKIGSWALDLARAYEIGEEPSGLDAVKYKIADKLVYSKLRDKLGLDRAKFVTSGGAALRTELANIFTAFGITVIQGYGLTETSPVITFSRPYMNKAGYVGPPIDGVEVMIAEDGEILTRGPHVMQGYYKAPDKTAEVIDDDGWFHTGDIGHFDGPFLKITDRKKDLFKLSTGKYVMPTPVESKLLKETLIEQAVVMGSGQKFCTALIFPSEEALRVFAAQNGLDENADLAQLVKEPAVVSEFERLVREANQEVPEHWSQVKRFKLVPTIMTVENELLTPTMKVKRRQVREEFQDSIDEMYSSAADSAQAVAV